MVLTEQEKRLVELVHPTREELYERAQRSVDDISFYLLACPPPVQMASEAEPPSREEVDAAWMVFEAQSEGQCCYQCNQEGGLSAS